MSGSLCLIDYDYSSVFCFFMEYIDFMCGIKYNLCVAKSEVIILSPRTGRPKAESPKDIKYSIRIDEDTEKTLKEYCQKHNITKGEAIRRGINLLLGKE